MHQINRFIFSVSLACFLSLCIPIQDAAALGDSERSAFTFAERKDWGNARGHARRSNRPALRALTEWRYVHDQDSGASFSEITAFAREHPGWPKPERLKLRAEQSLKTSDVSDAEMEGWFSENPPVSGYGKIKYAELQMREGQKLSSETIKKLIREGWVNGDFDEPEEKRILAVYGDLLRSDDHEARADRLLWEEKTKPANRMLSLLPKGMHDVARARIALIEDASDVNFHVSRVTPPHAKDPGLLYARLQYRVRRDDDAGIREILRAAPNQVPFPEKWWKQREIQTRKAIDEKNYGLAEKLLNGHSLSEGQEYADAVWLSGWLQLEFLNKPQNAYQQFYRMFQAVKFPVSKARAAYWAGRASDKYQDKEAAQNWYKTAASFPTTFYGQLAALKLNKNADLALPGDPQVNGADRQSFEDNEVVQAVKLCADAREYDVATALINHLVDSAPTPQQAALTAQMASELHSTMLGVRAAKRALQKNIVLLSLGYPRLKLRDLPIEIPLAHAITRQESEFDPNAKSRSGAVGMMQLLPSTAKEVAHKAGLGYTESKLYDIEDNILYGSTYLGRLISGFDGSYIQSIAAYNAGPRRVRDWRATFGAPGKSVESAVNWIEKIPYSETRNYVMRVMENLQVYRAILGANSRSKTTLEEDLVRGN